MKSFAKMIRPYCPSQYIADELELLELDMAVFAHEIGGDGGPLYGKPAEVGWEISHELGTTGYGVSVAFEVSLELFKGSKSIGNYHNISPNKNEYEKKIRVTIQGFGNVGSFTGLNSNELVGGIKIVGVSDVSGFIYNQVDQYPEVDVRHERKSKTFRPSKKR